MCEDVFFFLWKCAATDALFVPPDLEHKTASLKEKQRAISGVISEIEQKEMQKDDVIQKIEKLKEEQVKRKESKLFKMKWMF